MIRVFPRKTKWTPDDELAFVGDPPLFRPVDQPVKISITFTWDLFRAKMLHQGWSDYYSDVKVGGPALGDPGGEFEPGIFIKQGVTITSRGCSRKCNFCFVPRREGAIRELQIKDGWILQDNNILACSKIHQEKVFAMLQKQHKAIDFSGGLDGTLLTKWHIKKFEKLNVRHFWFSCDYSGAERHLEKVKAYMADYPRWKKRCYVLIGFNGETVKEAEKRLETVYEMEFLPFAQLYQGKRKRPWTPEWDSLQRKWCRPAAYREKGK